MRVYDNFVADLNRSQLAVLCVAGLIQSKGNYVILPPHNVTPDEASRYGFTDECDLLWFKPLGPTQKLQVKWSSKSFRSIDDFGFKWITVDEAYKIEAQLSRPPSHYFICNHDCTGAIVIPWKPDTWDHYETQEARQGNRICHYRRAPADSCQWRDLPAPFKPKNLSE